MFHPHRELESPLCSGNNDLALAFVCELLWVSGGSLLLRCADFVGRHCHYSDTTFHGNLGCCNYAPRKRNDKTPKACEHNLIFYFVQELLCTIMWNKRIHCMAELETLLYYQQPLGDYRVALVFLACVSPLLNSSICKMKPEPLWFWNKRCDA